MSGALGGSIGPYVTGRLKDATQSDAGGLDGVGTLALAAAVLAVTMPGERLRSSQSPLAPESAKGTQRAGFRWANRSGLIS
jgi:hypothetical protein